MSLNGSGGKIRTLFDGDAADGDEDLLRVKA